MIPRDYQQAALETLEAWLNALAEERATAEAAAAAIAADPALRGLVQVPDWTDRAWERLREAGRLPRDARALSPRTDAAGRPVPNATLKIPTGGGKTYLAAAAIGRIQRILVGADTGLVLWMVPNDAIYRQTLTRLRDRADPYRQALDRAGAGRVRILTKDDPLDARDVGATLCVLVLMMQSVNRQTQDSLRVFQESGRVRGFVPAVGDVVAHHALLAEYPHLTTHGGADPRQMGTEATESLGNAVRLARPIVVMDEGHKGFSDLAIRTIRDLGPRLILELTATPKERPNAVPPLHPNVLVDVRGSALHAEEMIKLPIEVEARPGDDWRAALLAALAQLDELRDAAATFQAGTGRYIRPIMIVQVERVGREQRGIGFIHAEDVREALRDSGLRDTGEASEIAEKTSVTDELAGRDLLQPGNPVRVIITKQALQEGWDCPFAYVLCCLAANRNKAALTQLIGRILRQPGAKRTGVAALDRCYVFTHQAGTAEVAAAIRDGLERDGMGDLTDALRERNPNAPEPPRSISRRPAHSAPIYLPRIVWTGVGGPREFDYDADILAPLDFREVDLSRRVDDFPLDGSHLARTGRVAIGLDARGHAVTGATADDTAIAARFDTVAATRALADLIPNAFVAHRLVSRVVDGLLARGATPDLLGRLSGFLQGELRAWLRAAGDTLAESRFRALLADGQLECRLRADGLDWKMPEVIETAHGTGARTMRRADEEPLQRSLFSPLYEPDFNPDEKDVACFLDERATVDWWHRSVARTTAGYALQGWRRQRIWPDFLFRHRPDGEAEIVALETKGDYLAENADTEYKRAVMVAVTEAFRAGAATRLGQLTIGADQVGFRCELVAIADWRTRLPQLVAAA